MAGAPSIMAHEEVHRAVRSCDPVDSSGRLHDRLDLSLTSSGEQDCDDFEFWFRLS